MRAGTCLLEWDNWINNDWMHELIHVLSCHGFLQNKIHPSYKETHFSTVSWSSMFFQYMVKADKLLHPLSLPYGAFLKQPDLKENLIKQKGSRRRTSLIFFFPPSSEMARERAGSHTPSSQYVSSPALWDEAVQRSLQGCWSFIFPSTDFLIRAKPEYITGS